VAGVYEGDWALRLELGEGIGWSGLGMIRCNFGSPSIRLVSHLNVTAPLLPEEEEEVSARDADYEPTSYFPLPPSPTTSNPPVPLVMGREQWAREPLFLQAWTGEPVLLLITALLHWYNESQNYRLWGSQLLCPGIPKPSTSSRTESSQFNKDGLWTGLGDNETRADSLEAGEWICVWDEECYIPIWPIIPMGGGDGDLVVVVDLHCLNIGDRKAAAEWNVSWVSTEWDVERIS
jgi:hypothetical protein